MRLMQKLFFIALLCAVIAFGASPGNAAISVKAVGGFHIGGKEVVIKDMPVQVVQYTKNGPIEKVDPNGEFMAGQMYVQYVQLEKALSKYPLLLWHGGGLTGVTYEDTPDGRPGWQQFFLNAGHDVYNCDAVERGRASWAKYPEIYTTSPVFRPKSQTWLNFRFGTEYNEDPAKRVAHPGQQFPVEHLDQFTRQFVPRWTSTDGLIMAAYNELIDKKFTGGCVVLAHSQGGGFAINAALANPGKVKGLILVEPNGAPDPDKVDLSPIKDIPVLIVWGDYQNNPKITAWNKAAYGDLYPKFAKGLEAKNGKVTWIDLPELGIKGNTHMLMMDKNSDQVAQVIQDWMAKQGLMR